MSRTKKPRGRDRPDDDDVFDELIDKPVESKPKVRKDGWPEDVPVLVADDICWQWSTRNGRHDLQVWMELTFNPSFPSDDVWYADAYRVLCEVITERFKKTVTSLWLFTEFTHKHRLPSLAWQAACWNEMLHRLGYGVPKASRKDPGFKPRKEDE
jgi:hypothetical protein